MVIRSMLASIRSVFSPSVPVSVSAQNISSRGRSGAKVIREPFTGAWQRNCEVVCGDVTAHHAVFSCMTLIASDIAKLPINLYIMNKSRIQEDIYDGFYSELLEHPNHFQTRNQFIESWVLSKLHCGNAYILKIKSNSGRIVALYVLNPGYVTPMIVPEDGSVYYRVARDDIAGISGPLIIAARDIIHDRSNCIFHPLVGLSPIYASGLAAINGLKIQEHATHFFENSANPGGILMAPKEIPKEKADELVDAFEKRHTGKNSGRILLIDAELTYQKLQMSAVDSQLIEQLKWSSEVVCSAFRVPPYKIGIGAFPPHNNVQSLNVEYYSQCLQAIIEAIEESLARGLGLPRKEGVRFDIRNLLRMDSVAQMEVLDKSKGILTPNEQRKKLGLPPVEGGDSPMMQQQNYHLEALAKRDAQDNPFSNSPHNTHAANTNTDDKTLRKAEQRAIEAELQLAFREGLEA